MGAFWDLGGMAGRVLALLGKSMGWDDDLGHQQAGDKLPSTGVCG